VNNPIRIVVAVEEGLSRDGVRSTLSIEPDVQVVSLLEGLDQHGPAMYETAADVTVVACQGRTDGALAFINEAHEHQPDRPLVVLCDGSPNGFVRRAFEAGADDIVSLPAQGTVPQTAITDQILFTLQKAVARKNSVATAGRKLGTMICVLGPKGGIGKTLTATNLAASFAARGSSVVLVDVDLQFGDVGLALGLAPHKTSYDLATSSGSLDEDKIEAFLARHSSGADLLLAPSRPDQAAAVTVDFLRNLYPLLRSTHEYVIIDTPPGFTPEVIASIDSSSDICMVGTLDSLSLKNTRLGLETLDLMGFDSSHIRVVLNRADSRVGITHNDVLAIIGRPPDVWVPSHRDIARAVNEGVPIAVADPKSAGARAFQFLAGMYAGDVAAQQPAPSQNGHAPKAVGGKRKRRLFSRGGKG
jgi:MinD-like ATPase involved in chromosome partitioning or flagellar assembly